MEYNYLISSHPETPDEKLLFRMTEKEKGLIQLSLPLGPRGPEGEEPILGLSIRYGVRRAYKMKHTL